MALVTRPRGQEDTPSGVRPAPLVLAAARSLDARPKRVVIACAVALVLHAPLLPTRIMGFMDLLASRTDDERDDGSKDKGEAFVPIDLDLDDLKLPGEGSSDAPGKPPSGDAPAEGDVIDPAPPVAGSASVAPPPPPPPPTAPPPPPPPPDPHADDALDAGVPDAAAPERTDAGEPVADAGPSDAGPSDAGGEATDAGAPDEPPGPIASVSPPDAGAPKGPGIGDPLDVGKAARGLTSAPNVQILLVGKQLRAHPLGADFGKMLREIKQWRGFFDGTNVDPVTDVEHMLITGPELRNSSKVVAVMDLSVPADKIRSAVDVVVKRDKNGKWLEGTPFPAAKAKADGAERLFVVLPTRQILTVLPGDEEKNIAGLDKRLPTYPKDLPFAIQLSMVTPHRAFRGIDVITIPETIGKMRLRVVTDAQGGARLDLEFVETDASKAKDDELVLEDQWKKVQTAALLGLLFLDDLDFKTEGDRISGSTHFTKEQLAKIMGLARSNLMEEPKKQRKKKGKNE